MDELRIEFNKLNLYSSQLRKNYEHYKNCFSDSFFCYADISDEEKNILERIHAKIREQIKIIDYDYNGQITIFENYIKEINNIEDSLYSGKNVAMDTEIHHLIDKLPLLDNRIIDFGNITPILATASFSNNDNNIEKKEINSKKMVNYNEMRDMELDDLIDINSN